MLPTETARFCDSVKMIQKKSWLSKLQLEEIRKLVEIGENNVDAQQKEQNQTRRQTSNASSDTDWYNE